MVLCTFPYILWLNTSFSSPIGLQPLEFLICLHFFPKIHNCYSRFHRLAFMNSGSPQGHFCIFYDNMEMPYIFQSNIILNSVKVQLTCAIIFALQWISTVCSLIIMHFCNIGKVNIFVQCSSMQSIISLLTNIYWATINYLSVLKFLGSISEKIEKKVPFLMKFLF